MLIGIEGKPESYSKQEKIVMDISPMRIFFTKLIMQLTFLKTEQMG